MVKQNSPMTMTTPDRISHRTQYGRGIEEVAKQEHYDAEYKWHEGAPATAPGAVFHHFR